MDIDYKYIKLILQEIKEAQDPYFDSKELYDKYLDVDDGSDHDFIFHWHLIIENGLISTNKGPIYDLKSSGLSASPQNPMKFLMVAPPIRLTTLGIDFLKSLQEPKVLEVITNKFKDEGFSAIIDISRKLGMKIIEKRLENLDF